MVSGSSIQVTAIRVHQVKYARSWEQLMLQWFHALPANIVSKEHLHSWEQSIVRLAHIASREVQTLHHARLAFTNQALSRLSVSSVPKASIANTIPSQASLRQTVISPT